MYGCCCFLAGPWQNSVLIQLPSKMCFPKVNAGWHPNSQVVFSTSFGAGFSPDSIRSMFVLFGAGSDTLGNTTFLWRISTLTFGTVGKKGRAKHNVYICVHIEDSISLRTFLYVDFIEFRCVPQPSSSEKKKADVPCDWGYLRMNPPKWQLKIHWNPRALVDTIAWIWGHNLRDILRFDRFEHVLGKMKGRNLQKSGTLHFSNHWFSATFDVSCRKDTWNPPLTSPPKNKGLNKVLWKETKGWPAMKTGGKCCMFPPWSNLTNIWHTADGSEILNNPPGMYKTHK